MRHAGYTAATVVHETIRSVDTLLPLRCELSGSHLHQGLSGVGEARVRGQVWLAVEVEQPTTPRQEEAGQSSDSGGCCVVVSYQFTCGISALFIAAQPSLRHVELSYPTQKNDRALFAISVMNT